MRNGGTVRTKLALMIPTLDRSGAEKQLALLATGLPRDEYETRVYALTRGGPYLDLLQQHEIPVSVLQKRFKIDPWLIGRLRAELTEFQPDIIHTWLFAGNAYGRFISRYFPAANVVVSERCVDSWKRPWEHWVDRWLAPETDVLVGNSLSVAEFYTGRGIDKEKLRTVFNGVEPISLDRAHGLAIKERLGWPQESWVVGFVGRLASQKRVDDLIWAVETLRQIRPQVRLLIVGDGPERKRLERFAVAVDCQNHCAFVGHQARPVEWLNLCNAVCLPSSFEGMSNTLMEAMSAGVPVLASDIPPNRELIAHQQSGLLFQVADRAALIEGLRLLVDQPEVGLRLAEGASRVMLDHFGVEQMVEGYRAIYESLR
jgi:glycosyltransferase involved in cell wall biosynthesis